MIINRDESEVTILGEVQKYKVSIDEKNLNHIVTILSSNLYSHPMQSFLREIVSNAIDSHSEAKVDEPIIITITDHDISIRDFGTGISPERFQEIYINIGSSTKRETNNYIGHFGIGRFSSLAVSDIVNITSFYNGTAYYYVMNKDIDQLHIDLLFEKSTDEHNGVEVKIPVPTTSQTHYNIKDWMCLAFISNIYINDTSKALGTTFNDFNRRKIYTYNTFKVLSFPAHMDYGTPKVLIGNIPYTVDINSLLETKDSPLREWVQAFNNVYPCLNIGDVDITPNREGLLYSERTKKALREAYKAAIEELTQLWHNQCNEESKSFKDFLFTVYGHNENYLELQGNIYVRVPSSLPFKVQYKDFTKFPLPRLKDTIFYLMHYDIPHFIAYYRNGEMKTKATICIKNLLADYIASPTRKVVILPNAYGFTGKYIKGFIQQHFNNSNVLFLSEPRFSHSRMKSFIRKAFGMAAASDGDTIHLIIALLRELILYIKQNCLIWDMINSPEYIQYKKDNREKRVARDTTKITTYIWYPNCDSTIRRTKTPNDIISEIKRVHPTCKIVYACSQSPFIYGFRGINYPNLVIMEFSQNQYDLVANGLFPDYVKPIEELYSPNNRILQRLAALRHVKERIQLFELHSAFPAYIRNMAKQLIEMVQSANKNRYYDVEYRDAQDILDVVPLALYDKTIMALYNQTDKYLKMNTMLEYHGRTSMFDFYMLMKTKKLRLDYDYYRKIKNTIKTLSELI